MLRNLSQKARAELHQKCSWIRFRANVSSTRTILLSGSVGLLGCALTDIQNTEESRLLSYLSATGLCVRWERRSAAFRGSSDSGRGVTTETAQIFKANRKSISSSTTEFQLSPTLKYTCITIADSDPNVQTLAERLVDKLPFAVSLILADAYSTAAENDPSFVGRGPGELPNPVPSSSAIDSAIEEAFELVHEATYSGPRPRGDAFNHTGVDQSYSSSLGGRLRPSNVSVLLGVINVDDRSLRVASTGNGDVHVIFGRRVITSLPSSRDPTPQVGYEVDHLIPSPADDTTISGLENKDSLTHPDLVSKPNITTRENIQPGDFAVFGKAQLWKYLTKDEVIGLVGLWVREKMGSRTKQITEPHHLDTDIGLHSRQQPQGTRRTYAPSDLPLSHRAKTSDGETYKGHRMTKKGYVCQDDSVSLHLLRNILRVRNGASGRDVQSTSPSSSTEEEKWVSQEKELLEAIEKEGSIGFTVVFF